MFMDNQMIPKKKSEVELTGLSKKIDWKKFTSADVKHHFQERLNKIKDESNQLFREALWNERVFSAQVSFTPVIGETYYLYKRNDGTEFLSLISPWEWSPPGEFVGATKSNHIGKWERLIIDVKSSPAVKDTVLKNLEE